MGLIKAATGALGGTLADQWKEYFTCDALASDVLVKRGTKHVSGRSSNTSGSDNVISNGSGIAVADGQCMMIVDQGKVIDVCAEPGQYTYNSDSEPSILAGDGIKAAFQTLARRFGFGGDEARDQRVYYFNIKEIVDNKFGTANPIPFRVVDTNIGLDLDTAVRCSGVYSFKMENPVLFYSNVCGNVANEYTLDELSEQLKTEFVSALQPAFAKLSDLGLRPNQIVAHNTELEDAMNEALTTKWIETRGFRVVSVAIGTLTIPDEDAERIKNFQSSAVLKDPGMAAATLAAAQAEAMKAAAGNESGAMNGFIGMGMAQQAGGISAENLYGMAAEQQKAKENESPNGEKWFCPDCGHENTSNFCPKCGAKRPED